MRCSLLLLIHALGIIKLSDILSSVVNLRLMEANYTHFTPEFTDRFV